MKKSVLWPQWVWTGLAAVWLGLFPLWQDGSYTRLTRAKLTGMWILTGATLAALVLTWALLKKRRETCRHTRLTPAHCLFGAYLGWVMLSAFLGSWADARNSQGQLAVFFGALRYEGLLTQLCYGVIFLTLSLIPVKIGEWLDLTAGSLLVSCVLVLMQYTGDNPLGLFPGTLRFPESFEFQGTLGNTNMVSAYLSMAVAVLAMGYVERGSRLWLLAALLGAGLMACTEVQSGLLALGALAILLLMLVLWSRELRRRAAVAAVGICAMVLLRQAVRLPWFDGGETIGLIWKNLWLAPAGLGLGLGGIRLLDKWKGCLSGKTLLLFLASLTAAGLALTALLPIPEEAAGLWELHEILRGRPQDSFGTWRLGLWRWTLDLNRESPLFGTGPDTFFYAMQDYLRQKSIVTPEVFDTPHNFLLGILSGSGWPALILFVGAVGAALSNVWRQRNQPGMLSCGAAVLCFLVQGMFTFSICIISPMFYALLGMACCKAPAPELVKQKEKRKKS